MEFTATSKSSLIEDYIVRELLPTYRRGERIPSELELSRQLRTSRPTIHKVLSNLTARGLLRRENGVGTFVGAPSLRNQTVSVILPSTEDLSPERNCSWFNIQFLLEGFTRVAAQQGVRANITYLHPDTQSIEEGVETLLRLETEFYLFTTLGGYAKLVPGLVRRSRVCIGRSWEPSKLVHTVYARIREGVRDAVAYLIASGRRRIAYLDGSASSEYNRERRLGCLDAMREAGLDLDPDLDRVCSGFPQDGYREIRNMWDAGLRPDAIFAGTDLRAFGVMELLRERGVRVPEDVAVVATDNLPESRVCKPTLSSVDYPFRSMGEGMFEMFQELAGKPDTPAVSRGYDCRFMKRESC